LQLMRRHVFLVSKKLTTFTSTDQGVGVRHNSGPKEPLSICLTHERSSTCVTAINPRVDILQYSASFIWCDALHQSAISSSSKKLIIYYSVLSCPMMQSLTIDLVSGKPPILRYIMNGVRQSEWISMTSGDSIMLSFGGGVSWDDSAAMVAFAKAFEILGSWSSYRKTHVGTVARLEPSLANSSVTSFFPRMICQYSRPLKLFSNLWSSWQYKSILSSRHNHSLLA
jgi:hypothetical protein